MSLFHYGPGRLRPYFTHFHWLCLCQADALFRATSGSLHCRPHTPIYGRIGTYVVVATNSWQQWHVITFYLVPLSFEISTQKYLTSKTLRGYAESAHVLTHICVPGIAMETQPGCTGTGRADQSGKGSQVSGMDAQKPLLQPFCKRRLFFQTSSKMGNLVKYCETNSCFKNP